MDFDIAGSINVPYHDHILYKLSFNTRKKPFTATKKDLAHKPQCDLIGGSTMSSDKVAISNYRLTGARIKMPQAHVEFEIEVSTACENKCAPGLTRPGGEAVTFCPTAEAPSFVLHYASAAGRW